MDPRSAADDADRLLPLALALLPAPVSVDALLELGAWRPAALFALLDRARAAGIVGEDAAAGPGHFRARAAGGAGAILADAAPADLARLVASPAIAAAVLAEARRAAAASDLRRARGLFAALLALDPAAHPGGPRAALEVVLETIRVFRSLSLLPPERIGRALEIAEAHGDLAAQALLLAAEGLRVQHRDRSAGLALLARAREAADASGSARVVYEIGFYVAISLVVSGRLREGIAAFEELLGDVPADLFAGTDARSSDREGPVPVTPVLILTLAQVSVGDVPRAIGLLHRLLAWAEEGGSPATAALVRLFLGSALVQDGDPESARAHADEAWRYWRAAGGEPFYAWIAASTVACVRAAEGRLDLAREVLAEGLAFRAAAGCPALGGSNPVALLETFEREGLAPPEGYALDPELDRILAGENLHTNGIAHRFRARKLLRTAPGPDGVRAARAHLEAGIALLREAGARPDLAHALRDAAVAAEAAGEGAEAAALRAEAARIDASLPRGAPADDPLRLASALLELGRLGALAPRREGVWGEIAARLCREFGAERCGILETGEAPRLLGVRGGGPAWQAALAAALAEAPPAGVELRLALPEPSAAGGPRGQLVLVPFAAEALGRRGVVALENRWTPPRVGERDARLLEALGVQLGVVMGNVALWQELVAARQRLEQENRYWRASKPAAQGGAGVLGASEPMRRVLELVARVAPATTPVLVTGETGVGKELVAHEVHRRSPRRDVHGPFIAVHVASLAPGLVASGLFGHERGAFTGATEQVRGRFELADGGTLFLDEVGELAPDDQVRLLRVLQEGVFERVGGSRPMRSDFRLVAATNRDLRAEVRAGRFREDLFFRLSAFPVHVPPLRERREEIPTLALWFMERAARNLGVRFDGISEEDVARLVAYPWPGNVRELEHVIERAAILSEPPRLRVPPLEAGGAPAPAGAAPAAVEGWPTLVEAERSYLRRVLFHTRGRVTGAGGAAELLGLKPSTLQFRIGKLGLRADLAQARAQRG